MSAHSQLVAPLFLDKLFGRAQSQTLPKLSSLHFAL